MTVTKDLLIKNLFKSTKIPYGESRVILEKFLHIIKINSKDKKVKITKFGTFSNKESPERVGRNPKTKESYIIRKSSKPRFKASNKIKKNIN